MHVQGDAAPRGVVSAFIGEPDYFCSGDKNLNGGGSGVVAFYSVMCGNGNPSPEVWKRSLVLRNVGKLLFTSEQIW